MRRLRGLSARLCALCAGLAVLAAGAGELTCVTWNMKWFPSGGRGRRLSEAEERDRVASAARVLGAAVEAAGGRRDRAVFCLQEVRDGAVCSNLVDKIGGARLRVAALSAFRDVYGRPLGQQMAILSSLDVVEAASPSWHGAGGMQFGRGCAYAVLDLGDGTYAAVFCVHLKSNLNPAHDEVETQRNIYKREMTGQQVLDRLRTLRGCYGDRLGRVVVAGDFNTNEDDDTFVSEATLRAFYGAHFRNAFTDLLPAARVTWPARGNFPGATLDHILFRGFGRPEGRAILDVDALGLSDHRPVAVALGDGEGK